MKLPDLIFIDISFSCIQEANLSYCKRLIKIMLDMTQKRGVKVNSGIKIEVIPPPIKARATIVDTYLSYDKPQCSLG